MWHGCFFVLQLFRILMNKNRVFGNHNDSNEERGFINIIYYWALLFNTNNNIRKVRITLKIRLEGTVYIKPHKQVCRCLVLSFSYDWFRNNYKYSYYIYFIQHIRNINKCLGDFKVLVYSLTTLRSFLKSFRRLRSVFDILDTCSMFCLPWVGNFFL